MITCLVLCSKCHQKFSVRAALHRPGAVPVVDGDDASDLLGVTSQPPAEVDEEIAMMVLVTLTDDFSQPAAPQLKTKGRT